jgi:NitT/TauT family transport system ATP-binding protein
MEKWLAAGILTMSDLRTNIPPHDGPGLAMRLPQGSIDEIIGLLKILTRVAFAQRVNLADLSDTVRYDQEKLLSLLELLGILGFAEVSGGVVRLTRAGRLYARASDHERKTVFAGQLAQRIPLAAYVRDVLEADPAHRLALSAMLVNLQQRFAIVDAGAAMRTVIAWARYAGFFFYDDLSGLLSLEQSARAHHPPQRTHESNGDTTP